MNEPDLDCLAIAAHPDDAELFAGGTLALAARRGRRVGILDLTRGECATRGTPELRAREAAEAGRLIGLSVRAALDLGDGDLANSNENRRQIVECLRRLRPRLVMTHDALDRHPDHGRAHELVRDAVFLAGVGGYGAAGERWQTAALAYFYGNSFQAPPPPDWIVDISGEPLAIKRGALDIFTSQFQAPPDDPRATYIASREFWDHIDHRERFWGHMIGASHGEPFRLDRPAHAAHPLVMLVSER